MIGQFAGAIIRGMAAASVVLLPALVLAPVSGGEPPYTALLVALILALLVTTEYHSSQPIITEFRDAPPYNLLRFTVLVLIFVSASLMFRHALIGGSAKADMLYGLGLLVGLAMDFPGSPVRLMTTVLSQGADPAFAPVITAAVGIAYLAGLVGLALFSILIHAGLWPGRRKSFNKWVNLPNHDWTAPGNRRDGLVQDARVNIIFGFTLPFLTPLLLSVVLHEEIMRRLVGHPAALVWIIAMWSFLPFSLFMRGLALGAIAELFAEKERGDTPKREDGQDETEKLAAA